MHHDIAPRPCCLGAVLAILQHRRLARRRVAPGAVGVELDLGAAGAAPAREALDSRALARVFDREGLALEALHAPAGFAVQTVPRHGHFSNVWLIARKRKRFPNSRR